MPESEDFDERAEPTMAERWRRMPQYVRWPTFAFATWVVLVLLIQLAAPNPEVLTMPSECPLDSLNCVRVADDDTSYRSDGLQTPILSAQLDEVWRQTMTWLGMEFGSEVLSSEQGTQAGTNWIHAVDRTQFWLFPDDVFVEIGCSEDGALAIITLQSQSRLGIGDLGENHDRLQALITQFESNEWSGERCDSEM